MLLSISYVFGVIFIILGCFISFASTIGFVRNNDFFIKVQAFCMSNFYGISFILIGNILKNPNFFKFFLMLIIIIVNIAITLVITHSLTRLAFVENVKTNAINRRNLKKNEKN
jgi:monovalent cation/proton antiporter MnhG/PhaG subunit